MNYPFFIARRYFRRGRGGYLFLTNLFAIISVAVGVASLILVLGVMNGFDRDLKAKIIGVFPPVEIQIPYASDFSRIEKRITSFPEVVAVAPFSETQAIFRSNRFLTAGLLRAIEPEKEDAVTGFQKFLISDSKDSSDPGRGAIHRARGSDKSDTYINLPLDGGGELGVKGEGRFSARFGTGSKPQGGDWRPTGDNYRIRCAAPHFAGGWNFSDRALSF
ncbi:MAG: hypothetical protein NTY10_00015 [Candidatus Omnitrophica bacterium]|nr:hypothetical protein [Candidatus Omnitrophota bacterium]